MNGLKKFPTGIKGLDSLLEGGMMSGRGILVIGGPGSGKTILLSEFIYRGITLFKQNGVFVTFEERPNYIINDLKSFDWDFEKQVTQKKLSFVDLSPGPYCEEVSDCYDLEPILERIRYAVEKTKAKRLVIDGIGNLFEKFSNQGAVREVLFRLSDEIKNMGITYMISTEKKQEGDNYSVEEYISDGIIELSSEENQSRIIRNIRISKIRGMSYLPEKRIFEIGNSGITIYPRMRFDDKVLSQANKEKCKFGIPLLDTALSGGLANGSANIIVGDPGSGKTTLAMHFIYEGIKNNQNGLYISFKDSLDSTRKMAEAYGWKFKKYEADKKLFFITNLEHPDKLIYTITDCVKKNNIKRVVIDSLAFIDPTRAFPEKVTEFLITLMRWFKINGVTSLFNYLTIENNFLEKNALFSSLDIPLRRILNALPDGIIILNYVKNNNDVVKQLNILKLRGSNHNKSFFNYDISQKGFNIIEDFKQLTRNEENNRMRAI